MKYYNLAKKYIKWVNGVNEAILGNLFYKYANITQTERDNFYDFLNNKYGNTITSKQCQIYINECNREYIKSKIRAIMR